jgi:hypothetical protein
MDIDQPNQPVDQREQLALTGQAQTVRLLGAAHALLCAAGDAGSSGSGGGGGGDSGASASNSEQLQRLEREYLAAAADLRKTLQSCRALAATADVPSAAAAKPSSGGKDDDEETAELRARAAALREALQARNAGVKAAIDRLRMLVDALAMWEAARRELAA